MSHTSYPVSPILPSDTPVESGQQVRGDAGSGEADVEVAGADAASVELEEEVFPQRPQASLEQPTASHIADHDFSTIGHGALIALKRLAESDRITPKTHRAE